MTPHSARSQAVGASDPGTVYHEICCPKSCTSARTYLCEKSRSNEGIKRGPIQLSGDFFAAITYGALCCSRLSRPASSTARGGLRGFMSRWTWQLLFVAVLVTLVAILPGHNRERRQGASSGGGGDSLLEARQRQRRLYGRADRQYIRGERTDLDLLAVSDRPCPHMQAVHDAGSVHVPTGRPAACSKHPTGSGCEHHATNGLVTCRRGSNILCWHRHL